MKNIGDFLKAQGRRNVVRNMIKYQTEEVKFSQEADLRIDFFDRKFYKSYITLWLLIIPFLKYIPRLF